MVPYPTEIAYDKRQVLLTRDEWGLLPPFQEGEGLPLVLLVPAVLFTYTETDTCYQQEDCKAVLLNLRDQYREKGLYELPWNFAVGGDGTVYELRGWLKKLEISEKYPQQDGVVIDAAHFGQPGHPPPSAIANAAWELVQYGVKIAFMSHKAQFYTDYNPV